MNRRTLILVDAGFLSKLSQYLGNGKYLKFDITSLLNIFAKKENFKIERIFYYTAPPFVSNRPTEDENRRKENYDKFLLKLKKNSIITIREGRCQRVKEGNRYKFSQKGVDTLLTIDLIETSAKYPNIKNVILIACDTDFIPAINNAYKKGVKTILYTYFNRDRNTNFSRSNELLQNVEKYVLIKKEDFEN